MSQLHVPGSQELLDDEQRAWERTLSRCSPEDRQKFLRGMSPEERLRGLPPEERLRGLSKAELARLRKLLSKPAGR